MWITKTTVQKDAVLRQRNNLIKEAYNHAWTTTEIADMFNINQSTVSRIVNKNEDKDEQ